MQTFQRSRNQQGNAPGISTATVVALVLLVIALTTVVTLYGQALAENGALNNGTVSKDLTAARQVDKLNAEIQKIRSETAGSLFWLKMIGLFVTVGSAVGGYLLAHTRSTNVRLQFDKRNEVVRLYQNMVDELSSDKSILRAAAAVRLGSILEQYPSTWIIEGERTEATKQELINLTKQVLASALSIESDPAVLKVRTISLARHGMAGGKGKYDMTNLNLSRAKAADAYWAECNLGNTDLYGASLENASFKRATLSGTQFRDASLVSAVLIGADCAGANFKRANLRNADMLNLVAWREITEIAEANISGVRNAPAGFKDWAKSKGAIEIDSDEEWRRLLNPESGDGSPLSASITAVRRRLETWGAVEIGRALLGGHRQRRGEDE